MELSENETRYNLAINMEWMAGNFKSYGLLSRLLKSQPMFITRAINRPQDLSVESMQNASKAMGLDYEVFVGDKEDFVKASLAWVREQVAMINIKKNTNKRKSRGRSRRVEKI